MKTLLSLIFFFILSSGWTQWSDFTRIYQERELSLVPDTAQRRIKSVLVFLSQRENLTMISSFIRELGPGVTFYVVKDPAISAQELLSRLDPATARLARVKFVDFGSCFTPWVQDYFMRLTDSRGSASLLPIYSNNLALNECKPFELGIADLLEKNFSEFTPLEPIDYAGGAGSSRFFNLVRVERYKGNMFQNSKSYSGLFPARHFKYLYGEGGSRIATRTHLFMDRIDLRRTLELFKDEFPALPESALLQKLEGLYGKRIVPVGGSLAPNQFLEYHIDFFLTPVERSDGSTVIFLGHPQRALDLLGLEVGQFSRYASYIWKERIAAADLIEKELLQGGFQVERVPLFYFEKESGMRAVTFNNAIQSLDEAGIPTAFVPDYDLPGFRTEMAVLRTEVQRVFARHGIRVSFVAGGEQLVDMNGQLRCSMGVLNYLP